MLRMFQAAPQRGRRDWDAAAAAPDSCLLAAQRADQAMREANKRAAAAAFQANNRAGVRDSDTLDLHDLYVEEALGCLRTRLGEARQEARACLQTFLHFWLQGAVHQSSHKAPTRHKQACSTCRVARFTATLCLCQGGARLPHAQLDIVFCSALAPRHCTDYCQPACLQALARRQEGAKRSQGTAISPAQSVLCTSQLRSAASTCWGCVRAARAPRRAWSTWSWCTARGTTARAASSG